MVISHNFFQNKKNKVMKKVYYKPEIEVINIKANMQLLAGSPDAKIDPDHSADPSEIEAPEFIF